MNWCTFTTWVSGELTKSPHFTTQICNFTANFTKNSTRMFYRKLSEFDFNSKQILVRGGAVEEGVSDMREVRGSNPCKDGNLQ